MESRETEIISLLEKLVAKQTEGLKILNNGEEPEPDSDEVRQKYLEYVKERLSQP